MRLTKFERELQDAIDNGKYRMLRLTRRERDKYKEAARLTLAKNKIITIRLNDRDLDGIKEIAVKSGKKYQTYIGELLHDHVMRRLKAA